MSRDDLGERVRAAEGMALGGDYRAAADRLGAVAAELTSAVRPGLLARTAWVASAMALAADAPEDSRTLAAIAARAAGFLEEPGAHRELMALHRRIAMLARVAGAGDLDAAISDVLADHARLLADAAERDDDDLWWQIDAERRDWPHLFAAVRAGLGRPSRIEQLILDAASDPVGAVVLAVAAAMEPATRRDPEGLASLCFRRLPAVRLARRRIDELLRDEHLALDGGHVVARRLGSPPP